MSVTLRNVRDQVANRHAFNCNKTLKGVHSFLVKTGAASAEVRQEIQDHILGIDDNYIIYSYETPIAVHNVVNGWWINDEKYSVTTSRHMGAIRMGIV